MIGNTAREQMSVPSVFTANTRRHCSSGIVSKGAKGKIAAALTSTWIAHICFFYRCDDVTNRRLVGDVDCVSGRFRTGTAQRAGGLFRQIAVLIQNGDLSASGGKLLRAGKPQTAP